MDPRALDRALRSPHAWPEPLRAGLAAGGAIEVVETHLSRLYFVGARVFKVKKAVDLGFVDFTTLAKRKQACDDEVRLNRRLASGVYLGVVPIVADGDDVRVAGSGEPIEYAVEMERLPAARMLDAKLARGEIDAELLERLAATLVAFHAEAERGADVDRFGAPDAVRERVLQNLDECRTAPPALASLLRGAFERFAREERARLEARVAGGRICEGHGDLHAGNVCVLPDRVVAFDCIEFSRPLRCLDVAADLAFLLMDLDRLGFPAFGRDLARRYALRAKDPGLTALVPFHSAHLALVRGKVAALRAAGSRSSEAKESGRRESLRFFALAALYSLPPFLLVTCGLPGSGKSTAARQLVPLIDALHVQSDFERKRLAGLVPGEPTPADRVAELYGAQSTERTYRELREQARRELARGRRVLLDANYPTKELRAATLAVAKELELPVVVLSFRVDDAEARRRLAERPRGPHEFSEADVAVYERARALFEPPDELAAAQRVDVAAGAAPEELLITLLERIVAQLDAAGRLPSTFPTG